MSALPARVPAEGLPRDGPAGAGPRRWSDAGQPTDVDIAARVGAYCLAGGPERVLAGPAGTPNLAADQISRCGSRGDPSRGGLG